MDKPKQWKPPFQRGQRSELPLMNDSSVFKLASAPAKEERESEKIPGVDIPKKQFLSEFRELCRKHGPYEVWSDFVTMFACAISNSTDNENYNVREERYRSLIRKYDKDDQARFPALAAQMVLALDENPEQDFLGDLYLELQLNDAFRGQFFTPYHVCELMADLTIGDVMEQLQTQEAIEIHDSCCGSGVTLIAGMNNARKKLEAHNLSWQNYILVTGQDIDATVLMMAYIQLSLLGAAGYFKLGNSLTEPMAEDDTGENYWITPTYNTGVWQMRKLFKFFADTYGGDSRLQE